MAEKLKLTRPELKRQRDSLARFQRYLPMLKLKQQQLQITMQKIAVERRSAMQAIDNAEKKFNEYSPILHDIAGVNVRKLAEYEEVVTSSTNIAGVSIPVYEDALFPDVRYSLFSTPAWVDKALIDLREISKLRARLSIIQQQHNLLQQELTKIIQRVNLFEKVKIPNSKENIRRIRIRLGDEMTAAVGRAKIAKNKLIEAQSSS